MTIELAIEYIPRRLEELGYGKNYNIRFRHYVLQPNENKKIDADNQLFILIEPNGTASVKSDFGVYDLTAFNVNELQYEHQGQILINNYTGLMQHVRFIQIIPKKENDAGK